MTDTDAAIVVDNVSKRFLLQEDRATSIKELFTTRRRRGLERGFRAVRDVSLSVPTGTTFGLIGHNGSGKSTLLRLMAGIHSPTSGTVTTRGRISALLELGSGFHPDLTGRENIYLNGAMLGLSKKDMQRNVDDIVEFAGLEEFIDQPVKVYSSGMYVRLGFAVAVHVEPEILLVDEVMAVGDEEFQRRCLEHMYGLRRDGVTIVFVSHSLGLVQTMCENVAWLHHGELMEVGAAAEVCGSYLEMVNADEAGRRSSEVLERDAERSIELSVDHGGTGEIRIFHIDLLNGDWERIQSLESGKAARLRLWYDVSEPVDEPIVYIDIFHEMGTHISGTNTHSRVNTGRMEVGQGYIDYIIDHVPLHPGNYYIGVRVADREGIHTLDQASRVITFTVVSSGAGYQGLMALPGRFEPPVENPVELNTGQRDRLP